MDSSDDRDSVCSEKSVYSCKSLTYDENESSTCDSIIINFNRCNVNADNFQKITLSSVTEEIEETDFLEDTVTELPTVEVLSGRDLEKAVESTVCNSNKEEKKTRDNSTNTESHGYKRKTFRQAKSTSFKYRPYGHNKHINYQHNNYYPRPFYNNFYDKNFNYVNRYQNYTFCNRWDCEMRHRQNQYFRNMLFRGIFHFTKFLEFISQTL